MNELKANQGKVEIEGTVTALKDVRNLSKPGFSGKVRNGTFQDDSGSIEISLWNDDCDKVGVGDKIKITNGWVSEYQGKLQLGTGKFGKLEVLEKGAPPEAPTQAYTNAPQVPPKPKLDEEAFDDGSDGDAEDEFSVEEEEFD